MAEAAVKIAFEGIRAAAAILGAFPYEKAAASLRKQMDEAWYVDPTTMIQPGTEENLKRKLQLLDAAATFMREWEAVKEEVLK